MLYSSLLSPCNNNLIFVINCIIHFFFQQYFQLKMKYIITNISNVRSFLHNIMQSAYASERIMIPSILLMAGDHLQSMLYFPIMTAVLFVTLAMGSLSEKSSRYVLLPLTNSFLLDKYVCHNYHIKIPYLGVSPHNTVVKQGSTVPVQEAMTHCLEKIILHLFMNNK